MVREISSTRFQHLIAIPFGLVFAVLAIVMSYAAFTGGSDVRSKAAQEIKIVKQWSFTSSNEGWQLKGAHNSSPTLSQGMFSFSFRAWDRPPVCNSNKPCPVAPPREFTPVITLPQTHSILKYPVNMLRIRLTILPNDSQKIAPFYMQLDPIIQGKPYYGVQRIENIIADGKEHEYRFRFPSETNLKTLEKLEISFHHLGKYSSGKVSINDIALIGMKEDILNRSTPRSHTSSVTPSSIPTLSQHTTASTCPVSSTSSALSPIAAYQFTYPSVVRTMDNASWIMVTGGILSQMPESLRSQAPGGASHARFPISQEELWISQSSDLSTWSKPTFTFNILPETLVAFKQHRPYKEVYPTGFKSGCTALPNGACNVQINDPSVVRYNGALYMYFTILENYRWYDGSIALDNTKERNRHSIGLAVSGDDGKNWAFVDKIIPENTTDTDGEVVLGAWAPSAVVVDDRVDVYFHDAFGTKQYVAQLAGGVTITQLNRLNKKDTTYRVNVDVIKNGGVYEMMYNDASFNIVRTFFTNSGDFGNLCADTIVVGANASSSWPTPHQVIDNGKVHLFFWEMGNPNYNHHWVRTL